MNWEDQLNKEHSSVENSVNGYQTEFKSQKRKKIIRWVIRQLYTGLFIYIFRESKYFNLLVILWIVLATLNLFLTLFLGKIIHWKFQKMSTKFQNSMSFSQDSVETIDIDDVEVVDVENKDPKIKE
jgi:hypothetical protein